MFFEINQKAVEVKNVYFSYNKRTKVIKNLNVVINKGEIFALLGSNGCGKTTLLKLILGRLQPEIGSIRVFGTNPNNLDSNVQDASIGYMPQELALFNELTISEILIYFGIIYHIKYKDIMNRIEYLVELLNLPEKDRKIGQLSGGQQRLTSIAVTMINSPRILILDEPTVGVDSLLRCRIWQYLEDMCHQNGKTVIITTHYIEEAKRAANVGFMKSGAILKQAHPAKLLYDYGCDTLEEVYLKLWQQNDRLIIARRRSTKPVIELDVPKDVEQFSRRQPKLIHFYKTIDFYRIMALLWKYYIRTKRFPFFLILFNIIPVIALSTMHFSIGQLPYDIPVAIYNGESSPNLSTQFINLFNQKYIHLNQYESNESAIDSVIKGKNVIAMTFKENFSPAFTSRIISPFEISETELDKSTIRLYPDFSESIVGLYSFYYFGETFMQFVNNFSASLGFESYRFAIPVSIETPIYGENPLTGNHLENLRTISDFLTPGALVVMFHLLSMAYSAFLIIYDRKEAHLDRYFTAGGQPIEVLISHYVQSILIIQFQVLIALICAYLFNTIQLGSYIEVYLLCVLQALQGMTIGLVVSLLFTNEISVAIWLSALMFPIWIMSGVFWPLEAIPSYFRLLADWTPITKPIDAIRSIMLRGWNFQHQQILLGYFVSLSYTSVLTILSGLLFHYLYI